MSARYPAQEGRGEGKRVAAGALRVADSDHGTDDGDPDTVAVGTTLIAPAALTPGGVREADGRKRGGHDNASHQDSYNSVSATDSTGRSAVTIWRSKASLAP